jgi:hypothetical protein
VFSVGCLWITLFGPSTELATYIFLAPAVAFACSKVLTIAIQKQQPFGWFPIAPDRCLWVASFSRSIECLVPVIRQNNYLHAIQPVAALLFLGFILHWNPLPSQPSDAGAFLQK